jgi:hypothetical protein
MYQRGGWTGPVCAMASAAGAILMSLPFLKAKFLLRTQLVRQSLLFVVPVRALSDQRDLPVQQRRPDGSFKYTGLFQTIGVMWREQRWGLIANKCDSNHL